MIEFNVLKQELISDPYKIKELLETYGYTHIQIHEGKYINFARDEKGSAKSIVLNLRNNEHLFVRDYPYNIVKDIFSYIIKMRDVTFSDVIRTTRNILGIKDYENQTEGVRLPFGGFYNKIKKKQTNVLKSIPETTLDKYENKGNVRFLRDKIDLKTQRFFGIRFSIQDQSIVIPVRNEYGELCGIKARVNEDDYKGNKYYYLHPTFMSLTLFGYSENYEYLVNNTVLVFESEKSVMQCYSYGIRNCVAIGSSSLSTRQIQLLLSLCPTKIILAHDKSVMKEVIINNATLLSKFSCMREFKIEYLDMEDDTSIPEKSSPSDMGKEKLLEILKERGKKWN